jgi:hypothetical protein
MMARGMGDMVAQLCQRIFDHATAPPTEQTRRTRPPAKAVQHALNSTTFVATTSFPRRRPIPYACFLTSSYDATVNEASGAWGSGR